MIFAEFDRLHVRRFEGTYGWPMGKKGFGDIAEVGSVPPRTDDEIRQPYSSQGTALPVSIRPTTRLELHSTGADSASRWSPFREAVFGYVSLVPLVSFGLSLLLSALGFTQLAEIFKWLALGPIAFIVGFFLLIATFEFALRLARPLVLAPLVVFALARRVASRGGRASERRIPWTDVLLLLVEVLVVAWALVVLLSRM